MTVIDHIKKILHAARTHEDTAHAFRVDAFAKYEASLNRSADRKADPLTLAIYEAARSAHERSCLAIWELETLLKTLS
jgi:hypothetical protein